MGTFAEVLLIALGATLVAGTLLSAMLTVVVPRAERPWITRWHFGFLIFGAHLLTAKLSPGLRDRVLSRLAPFALVTLPFVWAGHITVGFAFIYRGLGTTAFADAFVLSGSSLTTLGIRDATDLPTLLLVVTEALIGLGIVGLMISYLPTIYDAYTAREVAVSRLEIRAGRPPHPATFLVRSDRIGWIGQMDLTWAEWEQWFLEIEETHTTHTSLLYFRSSYAGRSWLVAAGTVLDAAALIHSTVDIDESPRAALCIRSGFTTLRTLADVTGVDCPDDPVWPDTPVSVDRKTFDSLCDELAAAGLPLLDDREQAWRDFAGWRVNYDAALTGLFDALRIDPGPWFRDGNVRPDDLSRPDLVRRRLDPEPQSKTNPA